MQRVVTIRHLEQFRSTCGNGWPVFAAGIHAVRVEQPSPELNRFFYCAVGGDWFWIDRLSWPRERWVEYLNRPVLETWLLMVHGVPAGYCEQELQPMEEAASLQVEIAYFGLLPDYIGLKLGSPFMQAMLARAWERGAMRTWLHTCDLDHPSALNFYRRQGFREFKEVTEQRELPEQTPSFRPRSQTSSCNEK